jgi:uncharacterized Fe-S cluster protein YjdI/CDGSH-type Zn-finger protein
MATRDYPTDGLTIHWDSTLCIHSGVCAATLPDVFRPRERPWILADAASADDLARTVDTCPSGALRYTRDGAAVTAPTAEAMPTQAAPLPRTSITVHADGPLEIQGEMTVVASDGTTLRESRRQYFCRCGNSGSKPFCDGSHNRATFTDDGLGVRRT